MNATRALIQRYFDAFNGQDADVMLECLTEDVCHDVNQGPRRVGIAAFREFCEHMSRCYREQLSDLSILVSEDGKRASAEFIVFGEYRETDDGLPPAQGQTYQLPAGSFFEIRGDRISRVTTYYNLQDWLEQVGT